MAKRKVKATKKAATKRRAPASSWHVGDRVRVKAGDFGNSVGAVQSTQGARVTVRIGSQFHEFDAGNIERGGPKDRF